jgi:hypothetical protein
MPMVSGNGLAAERRHRGPPAPDADEGPWDATVRNLDVRREGAVCVRGADRWTRVLSCYPGDLMWYAR